MRRAVIGVSVRPVDSGLSDPARRGWKVEWNERIRTFLTVHDVFQQFLCFYVSHKI